jgi:hypothetical protein
MRLDVICLIAALAATIVPVKADVTMNEETDIELAVFIPCAAGGAGEVVDLSGPLHTLLEFTINNNNVSGLFHFQPQGISGIGETSGVKYQATGITKQTFKTSLQNRQANLTFVNNFRIIGQGAGNNFLMHETLHITVNADGTATVIHDTFTVDCK